MHISVFDANVDFQNHFVVRPKQLVEKQKSAAKFNPQQNGTQTLAVERKALVGGVKNPSVFVVKDRRATKAGQNSRS
jgi:hypothetical protein